MQTDLRILYRPTYCYMDLIDITHATSNLFPGSRISSVAV